jgi:hypothetical protein
MFRDLETKRAETLTADVVVGELHVDLLFVDISCVAEVGIWKITPHHGSSFGITFLPKVKFEVGDNNATRVTELIERCHPSRSSFAWQTQGTNELRSVSHKTIRQTTRPLRGSRESLAASCIRLSDQLPTYRQKTRRQNRARWMFPPEQIRESRTGHWCFA